MEVGSLSGVVPSFLADCWVAVTDGTELQETEFVIETLDGTAKCLDCGVEFPADLDDLSCPGMPGQKAGASHRPGPDAQGDPGDLSIHIICAAARNCSSTFYAPISCSRIWTALVAAPLRI